MEIVGRRRGDATRLGYAMLLLTMRWSGRALEADEVPPAPVLAYVAQQLSIAPEAFADYACPSTPPQQQKLWISTSVPTQSD